MPARAGSAGNQRPEYGLGGGLLLLICGDVIRPGILWLLASCGLQGLTAEMARARDPGAFAALRRLCEAEQASPLTRDLSLRRIASIMVAKGGTTGDITAGDCLELTRLAGQIGGSRSNGMYFYQLLRATGVFPQQAPATVRMFSTQGQLSAGQLIDRYGIACRPVRDLLVDYLSEQQLVVDHASLRAMAHVLGNLRRRVTHPLPGTDGKGSASCGSPLRGARTRSVTPRLLILPFPPPFLRDRTDGTCWHPAIAPADFAGHALPASPRASVTSLQPS